VLDAAGRTDEAHFHLARYLRLTLHPDEAYATLQGIPAGTDADLNQRVEREMRSLQAEGV